jgi:hypothetical protein
MAMKLNRLREEKFMEEILKYCKRIYYTQVNTKYDITCSSLLIPLLTCMYLFDINFLIFHIYEIRKYFFQYF